MKVTQQTEEYEESEATETTEDEEAVGATDDDEGYEEDDEDDEDDDDVGIDTIFGIPKKFIIIGAAVLLLIIIILVIFVRRGSSDTSVEEDYIEYSEPIVDDTAYEDQTPVAEETPAGTVKDVVDSDLDAKALSQYGYTGDEIELAKQYGLNTDDLINNAKSRQDNSVRESIKQLSSTGSAAYQNLINKTYLGQEKNNEPVDQTKVESGARENSETRRINCTYEKCPTYGVQLYLKCKIYEGVYVWLSVKPNRWVKLPDTGSIVLDVTYEYYGDNVYVSDIKEVSSDLQTVTTDNSNPFIEEIQ